MRYRMLLVFTGVFLTLSFSLSGQSSRLSTYNAIGWINYFGNFKLGKSWGIHTEYQWRRANWVQHWQQSLLRYGVNYQPKPSVLLRAGGAWVETFPYGEYPINGMGKAFTEHRLFQMAQLTHREGPSELSHRFMLEQRFVGRYALASDSRETSYPLLHRARYLVRLKYPLHTHPETHKTTYVAAYNELFIGFGRQVNNNVFDQNRIGLLLGRKWSDFLTVEAGYLNQTLQYGRSINQRDAFQYNSGFIVNAYLTIEQKSKPIQAD
jgi:hypothetical protein